MKEYIVEYETEQVGNGTVFFHGGKIKRELIRCKDCEHRKGEFHIDNRRKEGGYWTHWCRLDTGDPFELGRNAEDDNWYCADGKRREDDD